MQEQDDVFAPNSPTSFPAAQSSGFAWKMTYFEVIQMIPRIFAAFFTHGITETSQKNPVLF